MTPADPPEVKGTWSEEYECLPLKQRLKMLLANSLSPIADVLENEEDSMGFHADQQHGTVHVVDIKDTMLPERLDIDDTNAQRDFFDDLDHIVLKQRQRMLLSSCRVQDRSSGSRPTIEHNSTDSSTNSLDMKLQNSGIGIIDKCAENVSASCEGLESGSFKSTTAGAPSCAYQHQRTALTESQNRTNAIKKNCFYSDSFKTVRTIALPHYPNVKSELVVDDLEIPNKGALNSPCLGKKISVKREPVDSSEIYEDKIDHMMLGDRMRLLASKSFPKTILYEDFENSRTYVPSGKPTSIYSPKPLVMKRPHKRRRTVTDSVETALEEDAPGLLQMLINKGVLVEEIKLYGEPGGDEALDESLVEESFSELEDVITKLFSQRQSLIKLPPTRCGRGEKISYCLACLISLVEQAHHLRVKKWPVEWGWCRDLQSFIFVFEKHNRIVLERPEYGYATYFFELVDSLPVHWQINRLVTSMKLTSCSRTTLIENRALMVGEDLTEGEARVLMEYGWTRNSGLGTMLNYRDRVVHDRKNDNENDSSEWRSKIGKLLTDGYNGGAIVLNDIPKKVFEYGSCQSPQIKSEY